MKLESLACPAALLAGLLVGGCTLPDPNPVTNQALGGPCSADSDCASGLGCHGFLSTGYPAAGSTAQGETSSLCTGACGSAACPAGSVCLTPSGVAVAAGAEGLCVPTCSTDGDCLRGGRAQVCATVADAGPSVCQFLECRSYRSSTDCPGPSPNFRCGSPECPSGLSCVARQTDPGGKTYGFCQQQ